MGTASILLLGPTGSGKTPLGGLWERQGIGGRPCFHFDFGAELRSAVVTPGCLDQAGLEIVRRALRSGALLEDGQFPIALGLLAAFLWDRGVGGDGLLILNGLPRHVGQARDMAAAVDVQAVVRLRADLPVLLARIRSDAGGDRAGRADDEPEAVAARLRLFEDRTPPLEAHYREHGVPALSLDVGRAMTAEQAAGRLEAGLIEVLAGALLR